MGFFKKLDRAVRRLDRKVYGGLGHKVRSALHVRGKNVKSLFKAFRPQPANSASSLDSSVYGATGSIVGRF